VTRTRAITTNEDQRVTFVELFFDLVFVCAVTQLVALLHHELSWAGAARAILVFWLVWWAWTQFTWALNSADTMHPGVELSVLIATAVVFLMAVVLPDAFSGGGAWFAITYVSVRVIGLAVYGRVAWDDPAKRSAVRRFALLSAGSGIALAAGITLFLGGTAAALWRAGHRALIARPVILASVLAGLWATREAAATWSLMIAVCGVTAVAAVEQLALLTKVR
jgi:low temperature requirement protein LtrA